MQCPSLWANQIGRVVSKKIWSCFGAVWWNSVLQEDEIIVWIQTAAFWQQGRLQKVNVSLLVDFSLLRVDEKNFCFSIPRYTCTNHQLLRKPISVVIKCLQTLFYECNTISLVSRLIWKHFRWKFIDIFEDVCSLHICFSADSFHLLGCITPCESSGRFFGPSGIILIAVLYNI